MKIVHFSSGLGNQVFFYLFCEYLKNKYPNKKVYGYYNAKQLTKHNGLELDRAFNLSLPQHTILSDFVALICRKINGLGIKGLKTNEPNIDENAIYFDGYYQDKKYMDGYEDILSFKRYELDDVNKRILESIESTQSVALHVRRGDYLQPQFVSTYGNICTAEYYKKAINIVKQELINPRFFLFSDDIEWCKKNLPIDNSVYVDNNQGVTSYIDMFLMSKCKANILANSSFSYWGAMMNKNDGIVIYPKKWNNKHTPDIFPNYWIGL